MIKSFRHKGLQKFFETGSLAGIQAKHAERLEVLLIRLQHAKRIEDMNIHGFGLHPLKWDLKGFWALKVSGNWRIIFRVSGEDVYEVNLVDYH